MGWRAGGSDRVIARRNENGAYYAEYRPILSLSKISIESFSFELGNVLYFHCKETASLPPLSDTEYF